tara:strand:- start:230 stop:676 length:447 start_codon:yes stop_codon:yes gene_type:complete
MSAREDVKDKVQRILTKNFEVRLGELDDYYIDFGSSAVRITIDEPRRNFSTMEIDAIWVCIQGIVLWDVPSSPELYKFVAKSKPLGGLDLHLVDDGNNEDYLLGLQTSILGNFLDEDELVNVVAICGLSCDEWDEDFQAQFGGTRNSE